VKASLFAGWRWRETLAVLLVAGGVGLAAFLLWTLMVVPQRDEHAARLSGETLGRYAGLFEARIAELAAQLKAAAEADATIAALRSDDPAQPALANRQLSQLLHFAERVELFRSGSAEVDLEAAVPITFAAVQVIRAAETNGFGGPEGIRTGPSGSRLFAARAVEADGARLGVVFIAISTEYLLQPLRATAAPAGRLSLVQSFARLPPLPLLEWGDASGTLAPAVHRELAVPHWSLAYEARPLPVTLSGGLFAALTAAFGLLLGSVSVVLWRSRMQARESVATGNDIALESRTPRPATGASSRQGKGPQPIASAPLPVDPAGQTVATPPSAQSPPDGDALDITPVSSRLDGAPGTGVLEVASPAALEIPIAEIFRAYDIRGIADHNLSPEVVYWIGRAFAAEALDRERRRAVIGHDGRHSSPPLREALVRGLTEGGIDVLDAGQIPTPVLYYAAQSSGTETGIMITGSHNPPEYNGLKMLIGGETLAGDAIQALRARLVEQRLSAGHGDVQQVDVAEQYLTEIADDVVVARPLKVVVDCGNGVAGVLAPVLLERLGCDVIPLYCDVNGDFPNHHPDPAVAANLEDLITVVRAEAADLGIAFDGDGDRIGVVTGSGRIIWPDRLLMLFAQDVVGRNPGADIIYDVKCSRHLNTVISDLGGRPILWKTGHSHLKAKLKETRALLAGEFSGHICFGERWYGFDDALYAAARLLEIVGGADDDLDTLLDRFPDSLSTPEIKVATTEQEKFAIIERLASDGDFGDGTITTIDGLRVDYADGWGLVRASNTSPVLTLRFEADDQAALERIQERFQDQLTAINHQLRFR